MNLIDIEGKTALIYGFFIFKNSRIQLSYFNFTIKASSQGFFDIADSLIRAGANVNARDFSGNTALYYGNFIIFINI